MLFNSIDFGIFFPIVFLLYWLLFSKNKQARNIFLITVSYIFYGWWDWRFLSLIVISSFIDFYVGKRIYAEENGFKRKKLLWLSLFVNLGFLGFFKYYNFFVDSFISSFSLFGFSMSPSSLNIILPVGISFYTFQTLSYTLDIYFKKMKPTNDIFSFFCICILFPTISCRSNRKSKELITPVFRKKSYRL